MASRYAAALIFCATSFGAGVVLAQSSAPLEVANKQLIDLLERHKAALVRVRSESPVGVISGTGFFVGDGSRIITSANMVASPDAIWVEQGSGKYPADVVGVDRHTGVALLKCATRGLPLRLSSEQVRVQSAAVLVGYPFDKVAQPVLGNVLSREIRSPDGRLFGCELLHTSHALAPGLSGSPLLDANGLVLGMVMGSVDGGHSTYAVPAEALSGIVMDLEQFGRVRQPWIGMGVREVEEGATRKVWIEKVIDSSPAQASGLQAGDHLVQVGDRSVSGAGDVMLALRSASVEKPLLVIVRRGQQMLEFRPVVSERPNSVPSSGLAQTQESLSLAIPAP